MTTLSATYLGGHLTFTSIIQLQYIPTHQQPVGVGLHYQLPIWVDTSRLLASHNYNTPTAGRRGATLSATYLGGHLTFTTTTTYQQPVGVGLHYQLPIWVDTSRLLASHNYNTPTAGRRGATLSATYLGGHLTFTSNHRHADRQTDRQDRQTEQ